MQKQKGVMVGLVRQEIKEYLPLIISGLIAILAIILFFIQLKWINEHTYKKTYKTTVTITKKKEYTTTQVSYSCGKIKIPRYHTIHHYELYYKADYKGIKAGGMINNHYLYNLYSKGDKEDAIMIVRYYADNTNKKGQIYGTPSVEVSWRY